MRARLAIALVVVAAFAAAWRWRHHAEPDVPPVPALVSQPPRPMPHVSPAPPALQPASPVYPSEESADGFPDLAAGYVPAYRVHPPPRDLTPVPAPMVSREPNISPHNPHGVDGNRPPR